MAHRAEQTQQVLTEIKPFLLIWPQVTLVSFAAVIRVVTQHNTPPQWGGSLCDDPNNGCEGD